MQNDARNSLSAKSLPYHSGGTTPLRTSVAAGEKLENVNASYMTPEPHGETAASRKEVRL